MRSISSTVVKAAVLAAVLLVGAGAQVGGIIAISSSAMALVGSNIAHAEYTCRVNDPTGTPLNLRATAPNGLKIGTLSNGTVVRVLEVVFVEGKRWARLGDKDRVQIGWVYRDYLDCQSTAQPSAPPSPNGVQRPPQRDKIFGYPMYDNVVGITFFGPVEAGDEELFKKTILSYLGRGRIVGNVGIFSQGGNVDAAIKIGEQIRLLRARTDVPSLRGTTRICQLDPKITDEGIVVDGALGRLTYDTETGAGDPRCRCESACSLIWSGGVGRRGDVVGVHRFRFADFGGLGNEEARELYQNVWNVLLAYHRRMEVPENIIEIVRSTASLSIRYLSKNELTQMDNMPIFLMELLLSRCGVAPGSHGDRADRVKYRSCLKEVYKEEYKAGAREYLNKYQ
jgi:hypothetical protein